MKPHLFQFASMELIQEAFWGWLLKWSQEKYKTTHPELFERSKSFIELIADKDARLKGIKINEIEIKTHFKKFGLLAIINQSIIILFDRDLKNRYCNGLLLKHLARIKSTFTGHEIVKISFVTDYIWQEDKRVLKDGNFHSIDLNEINKILKPRSKNDIYEDYVAYIKNKVTQYESYSTQPLKNWGHQQWIGLFYAFSKKIEYLRFYRFVTTNEHWFVISHKGKILQSNIDLDFLFCGGKLMIRSNIRPKPHHGPQVLQERLTQLLEKEYASFNYTLSDKIFNGYLAEELNEWDIAMMTFDNIPVFDPKTKKLDFGKSLDLLNKLLEVFENIEEEISV